MFLSNPRSLMGYLLKDSGKGTSSDLQKGKQMEKRLTCPLPIGMLLVPGSTPWAEPTEDILDHAH